MFTYWEGGGGGPRLRSQTQSGYVQTGPDGKCLCPDRPRLKVPMSRPSQTESGYVQNIVRSKFFVRSSCVRRQICPDHPRPKQYMSRLSCVLVQTIVRSNSNSCVQHQIFSASMSRPSCVQIYILWCCAIPWRWRLRGFEISTNPDVKGLSKNLILNHFFYTIEGKTDPSNLGFWNLVVISTFKLYLHFPRFLNLVVTYFKLYQHFAYTCSKYMQNANYTCILHILNFGLDISGFGLAPQPGV